MLMPTVNRVSVGNSGDGHIDNLPGNPRVETGVVFLHPSQGKEENSQASAQRKTVRTIEVGRNEEERT